MVSGGVDGGVDEAINEAVKLLQRSDNKKKNYTLIGEAINEAIKEELGKVVDLVFNDSGVSRIKLIKKTEKSKATIERYLKILRENNIIEYKGSNKTGGYYLTAGFNRLINE